MDLTATQEIILRLKAVKKEKDLSLQQIIEQIESNGDYLSMTTLRRVFADGSETEDAFNYERTIKPIARVLLYTDKDQAEDDIPTLKAIIRLKNEELADVREQIATLVDNCEKRVEEYEHRLQFLRDQIEKKDARMDEKDQIIHLLLQKVFPDSEGAMCIRCPVHNRAGIPAGAPSPGKQQV